MGHCEPSGCVAEKRTAVEAPGGISSRTNLSLRSDRRGPANLHQRHSSARETREWKLRLGRLLHQGWWRPHITESVRTACSRWRLVSRHRNVGVPVVRFLVEDMVLDIY